ncbi:MAG: response regulator [Gammaproteobacteria bacterium]|nr:MAG: response regulator [Gammaproteobacteria bacterium]
MATLLLVEDNDLNRDMLSRRLAREGFIMFQAKDGEEALLIARTSRPDLILMDLGLPLLDGWEVIRRLRQDASTRHMPVIALTAHATREARERAFEAGCDDYDVKPIDFPRLLEKIRRLLPDHLLP